MNGKVVAIFIAPLAGAPMQEVLEAEAVAGKGLRGDRYGEGAGSFNKNDPGTRQVTLINAAFFPNTPFEYADSRRNIVTENIELMWLIGKEFTIGEAVFRGIKYCDPCERPNKLAGEKASFKEAFSDRGGLLAEVIQGGTIKKDDSVIPPPKNY